MSNLVPINDRSVRGTIEKRDPTDDMDSDIALTVSEIDVPQKSAVPITVQSNTTGRDWAAAVLLVQETAEAIRQSKEREAGLELEASQQLKQYHVDLTALHAELVKARAEIEAANDRTKVAEQSLSEATVWLDKMAEAITNNFGAIRRTS